MILPPCAAFGSAKIWKRRRINFHKKRSFSHLAKFDVKFGAGVKIFTFTAGWYFSIFGSKSSHIQGVILKFSARHLQCPFGVQRHKPNDEREARVSQSRIPKIRISPRGPVSFECSHLPFLIRDFNHPCDIWFYYVVCAKVKITTVRVIKCFSGESSWKQKTQPNDSRAAVWLRLWFSTWPSADTVTK